MSNFAARLDELMERATKVPWAVDPDDRPNMEWNNHIVQVGAPNTICFMSHDPRDNSGQQAAAEIIVYLVNYAPAIRDLVRAAEKEVAPFFRSGNCFPVERAVIRREQISGFLEALAKLEEA